MLPRFRHLLVPLDFTEKNRAALDIAFELAVQNRAAVTLLHVIEPIDYDDDEELAAFFQRLEQRAATELEALAQRFLEAGVAVEWKVRRGHRAAEIVAWSIDRQVDLIVMSSHRVQPGDPVPPRIGTLSHQVSMFCQCPVLLVK